MRYNCLRMYYGSWWMLQVCFDGWISLGVHLDLRTRIASRTGIKYGPYLDVHLLCCILSVGRNPKYSSDLESDAGYSRGGIRASDA